MLVHNFKNIGYLTHTFNEDELSPIKKEISTIQDNFDDFESRKYNPHLAGMIRNEYLLTHSKPVIEKLLSPLISAYDDNFNYFNFFDTNTEDRPITIGNCWVNFQKKYEFNPSHWHSGVLSFVLYIKVHSNIEEERENSPGKNALIDVSSNISFLYTNVLGRIEQCYIPIDKKYENTVLLFPSKLTHMVYPFYESDDFRISVSGNFHFDTK